MTDVLSCFRKNCEYYMKFQPIYPINPNTGPLISIMLLRPVTFFDCKPVGLGSILKSYWMYELAVKHTHKQLDTVNPNIENYSIDVHNVFLPCIISGKSKTISSRNAVHTHTQLHTHFTLMCRKAQGYLTAGNECDTSTVLSLSPVKSILQGLNGQASSLVQVY